MARRPASSVAGLGSAQGVVPEMMFISLRRMERGILSPLPSATSNMRLAALAVQYCRLVTETPVLVVTGVVGVRADPSGQAIGKHLTVAPAEALSATLVDSHCRLARGVSTSVRLHNTSKYSATSTLHNGNI